ncbi:MAG: sugar-specific transcriptional regulator TrmB [Methanomicrobiales archaeon]
MREFTLEKGSFTTIDIARAADVPRSTAQDWINRLTEEGCIVQKGEARGRKAARYMTLSAVPSSTCRRIFTTTDQDEVEIYHECMSAGCAAFCVHHHHLAGGAVTSVQRDGTLLRERTRLGGGEISIGLYPASAVGVSRVWREGDHIVQRIRCIGGPAYSLTDMMGQADGVCDVRVVRRGDVVEGEVHTHDLAHCAIGVDDTDSAEGGATFAVSLALLQHLINLEGVMPITHRVVMLDPHHRPRTAGNSCSFIEIAVPRPMLERVEDAALRFVSGEALSPEWGIAVRCGFLIPPLLREFGAAVRAGGVDRDRAEAVAGACGARLHGGNGVIGGLAALAFPGCGDRVLLDPSTTIPMDTD